MTRNNENKMIRVYADFNHRDEHQRVLLDTVSSLADIEKYKNSLQEGMKVILYMTGEYQVEGVLVFDGVWRAIPNNDTLKSLSQKTKQYKYIIDELVRMCLKGQGQIAAKRTIDGVWNRNIKEPSDDQFKMNQILAKLSKSDRGVIAKFFSEQVQVGVFETLKTLETFQVTPFEDGYEGSAYNDFIGRLDDWEWPCE